MIAVLIVDDHRIVREGLKQMLDDTSEIVVKGEAQNGQEALALVQKNHYDVVLLDVAMPRQDGMAVLNLIKQVKPALPVLMLTMFPEEQYAVRFLKAGASGYLTKESALDELVDAIHRVARGGRYVTLSLAEKLAFALDPTTEKPPHELLSGREFQVLCLIATGKSIREIGEELSLSAKTISTYRSHILDKLGLHSTGEIVHYALKAGLV
jgi:two-component system, NarL family, invasion response regulator UvrY